MLQPLDIHTVCEQVIIAYKFCDVSVGILLTLVDWLWRGPNKSDDKTESGAERLINTMQFQTNFPL